MSDIVQLLRAPLVKLQTVSCIHKSSICTETGIETASKKKKIGGDLRRERDNRLGFDAVTWSFVPIPRPDDIQPQAE